MGDDQEVDHLNISAGIVKEIADQNLNRLDMQTVQDENTKKDLEAGQEVGVDHQKEKKGKKKLVTEVIEMATIVIVGIAIGIVTGNVTNIHLPNLVPRAGYCRSSIQIKM